MKTKFNNQKGLTLIEIIIVLVILSILFSFLTGGLFSQGEKAKAKLNKLRMDALKAKITEYQLTYSEVPSSLNDLTGCPSRDPNCIPMVDKEEVLEIIRVKEFDKTEYGYDNLLLLGGCKMPSNHFSKLEDELELLDDDNEEDEDEFMVKSIFRSKRDSEIVAVPNSVANKRQLREMLGDDFFN